MRTIHMQQEFDAPVEKVFATLTDHVGMAKWVDGAKITLDREGDPPPNGLGAVRRIKQGPMTIVERVVLWDEPRQMNYEVIQGPIRDHLGEMRFESRPDGGSRLDYRIRFSGPWYLGGPLFEALVAKQLKAALEKGLGKVAVQLKG